MRSRAARCIGAGLGVVAVVIVFIVAQSGGGGSGPLDAIARAAEVAQREPGGIAAVRMTIAASDSPEGLTEDGRVTFEDGGRSSGTFLVVGHSTGKRAKVQEISDTATGTVYASSDQFDPQRSEGKKWLKIDLSAAIGGSSSPPAEAGPEEGLKLLEDVDGAEEVGKEDVQGVLTTHYRGTTPATEEVFGVKVKLSEPQVDIWIDSQDHVRRMEFALSGSVKEGEAPVTTEVTIDYVHFGRVRKIELPNSDEVFDATELIESKFQSAVEGSAGKGD
jgi:hypothetical protein